MTIWTKRWAFAAWLLSIVVFAALHFAHLRADFPNHSPWMDDWAKYTDEGWYGNAAIRAHLLGHWYLPGDFNPAPAVPVWPFLEWLLFFVTGVNIAAARALAVAFFCLDLLFAYLLLRARGPRWMGMVAVTLAVTSPFLYAFSRLAILEPMLLAFFLAALNLAIRLPKLRRPLLGSVIVGLLFTLMLLTKTTAVFLLPALTWALLAPARGNRRQMARAALPACAAAALSFATWMGLVVHARLFGDFQYLFSINTYTKPTERYWPLLCFWWSLRGAMWGGRILIPLAAFFVAGSCVAFRASWSRCLRTDPVFGASVLAVLGYLLFMTYQNHPQPRYYTVVALFACILVALGARALLWAAAPPDDRTPTARRELARLRIPISASSIAGYAVLLTATVAVARNAAWTLSYAAHPEYTFITAAQQLTRYIDRHPNGNRLLVATSGDEIALMTHLPSLCDDFGTEDLPVKLAQYQPGWWATWNDIDPGTLEDLHTHYSLEQVASFRALDHPERNVLVLFKLHPLPQGVARDPDMQNLQAPLPGDEIEIPIQ